VVAVTGVRRYLGTELIRRLEEDPRYSEVLALDVRPPDVRMDKTEFCETDLTIPTVDDDLARLLSEHRVDTVVHGAFLTHPTHATEWAHELEDIGTMHLLNACAESRPRRFILLSTTMVYGALRDNPNFLAEDAPLRGHSDSRYLDDKVSAERQVMHFAEENPDIEVCILRFAPVFGPSVDNFFTRFFARPVAPRLMGHDPLLQFIHESDATLALSHAVAMPARGPFNIVGKGVLPYSTLLALMGRVPLPMPYPLARTLSRTLWATQIFDAPPSFLEFLRYLCVADGVRAARELGFVARYSINDAVRDFLGVPPDGPDLDRMAG
jgi:UDP-glucose 4-epimerase